MNKALRYISITAVVFVWLIANTSCVNLFFVKKTFHGKVIDADTKEPIEGAVVVAEWLEAWPTLAGEGTRTKDVKEALTDKNGEWSIRGPKGKMHHSSLFGLYYTREPNFIIFRPGYCPWPQGFAIDACKQKFKPGGTGEIMEGENIELPKLPKNMKKEDRLRVTIGPIYPDPSDDPALTKKFLKKQKEFLRLIDEDRRNLGLEEYKIYEELKNEK